MSRMEMTVAGVPFHDEPTFSFINRLVPVPDFTKSVTDNVLTITTPSVTLRYHCGSGKFSDETLSAVFHLNNETQRTWTPSMPDNGNLYGTIRTLDGEKGWLDLNCSRVCSFLYVN